VRVFALALLLLSACARQSGCEAAGGLCVATREPCPGDTQFSGYDGACEPQGKCCRPLPGFDAGRPDAGAPQPTPCAVDGLCRKTCLASEKALDAVIPNPCLPGEVCCASR